MAEMHVWMGTDDPLVLPVGGLTVYVHQGSPPVVEAVPVASLDPGRQEVPELKLPTGGLGTYRNLMYEVTGNDLTDWVAWFREGSDKPEIAVVLPEAGTADNAGMVGPLLDGLRRTSYEDLTVHLIHDADRRSDG